MNFLTASLAFLLFLPQGVSGPADFLRPPGGTLQARYDTAVAQGRASKEDTFWVAYQMPERAAAHIVSPDGIESVRTNQPERVGLFLLVRRSDGAIDRIRIVNLSQDIRVHDRQVYWLGEPNGDENGALLLRIARISSTTQVKNDAIFWLGQEISRQAGEDLEKLATNDPEVEVQKQAVFALSQRRNDESIPSLERIAKEHPNSAVRKQAIFWLGQKRDPRVLDFFEQLLKK